MHLLRSVYLLMILSALSLHAVPAELTFTGPPDAGGLELDIRIAPDDGPPPDIRKSVLGALDAFETPGTTVEQMDGTLLVRTGTDCAEWWEGWDTPFGQAFSGDAVMDGRMTLPPDANQATVYLNGWRLLYLDDDQLTCQAGGELCYEWLDHPPSTDHHLASARVWMNGVRIEDGELQWTVHGHLADRNADDPFGICYTYLAIAWNDEVIDARSDEDVGQAWSIEPNPVEVSGTMPAPVYWQPVARLPRGFHQSWVEPDTDRHLHQIAYHLVPERTGDWQLGWRATGVLKDDASGRESHLNTLVAALGGAGVEVVRPSFEVLERTPSQDAGGASETIDVALTGLDYDFAVPVLSGWDLWFPGGDQHLADMGVSIHDIHYEKPTAEHAGTLRYKVTRRLRDKDGSPGARFAQAVNVIGLYAALGELEMGTAAAPTGRHVDFHYASGSTHALRTHVQDETVYLRNVGTTSLALGRLSLATFDRGHFGLSPWDCYGRTLEPGESCAIYVRFVRYPGDPIDRTYSASVSVWSDSTTAVGGLDRLTIEARPYTLNRLPLFKLEPG